MILDAALEAWHALVGPGGVAKSAVAVLLAWVATRMMRRSGAALRHTIWTAALLIPLLDPVMGALRWRWATGPAASAPSPAFAAAIPVASSVAAPSRPPESTPVPATPASPLVLVWGLGAVVLAARFARAWWRAAAIVRRAEPVERRGAVRIRRSTEIDVPVAWDGWHPVILLPARGAPDDPAAREAVLRHELAHLVRHDGRTQLLAQAALVLQWFNPSLWFGYHRLLVERELACDDAVLATALAPSAYAAALFHYAARPTGAPGWAPRLLGTTEVERRIRRILDPTRDRVAPPRGVRRRRLALVASAALLLAASGTATARPALGPAGTTLRLVGARNGDIVVRAASDGPARARITIVRRDTTVHLERPLRPGDALDGDALLAALPPHPQPRGRAVHFELLVPPRSDLRLESANGDITVIGVTGDLWLRSVNGRLRVDGVAGRIDALTINGDVTGVLGGGRWSGDGASLRSINGRVDLGVPEGLAADLAGATRLGMLDLGLDVASPACAAGDACAPRTRHRRLGRGTIPLHAASQNADVRWRIVPAR